VKGHYIPQFYLRGFTDPDLPDGHDPFVWIYGTDDRRWRRRAPKNVAAETDYYIHDSVEAGLSGLESIAATVIREKVLAGVTLDDEARYGFAMFVATMMMRVPAMHEHVGDFLTELFGLMQATLHQAMVEDPSRLEALKEECRRETGKCDFQDARPEHLDPANARITATHTAALGMSFSALTDAAEMLARMGWTFIRSQSPHYFITSDAPYFMADPKIPPAMWRTMGTGGLGSPRIQVTLPVTRDVAFMAGWHGEGERRVESASRRLVSEINYRSGLCARRFLIAPKQAFPGAERLPPAPAEASS